MLTVSEAQRIVLSSIQRMPQEQVSLPDSVDRILATEIVSDIELPPFDRSTMDGYAVRSADVRDVPATLQVIEVIPAGQMPQRSVGHGQAALIMTGAPVPKGADAVVIVEEIESVPEEGSVRVLSPVSERANISFQGEDLKQGTTVLEPGCRIRPSEIAVLAMLGHARVTVAGLPEVTVLTTGDEIVEVEQEPGPAQIRDSNSWAVMTRLRRLGIRAERLGIAPDAEEELEALIRQGMKADLLILSGGVSVGTFDLIPGILESCAVRLRFQKVRMKPGKPTVFGTHEGGAVFGLPGNPVSAQVAMELFVIPALKAMMGARDPFPRHQLAVLSEQIRHRGDRDSYRPVILSEDSIPPEATPVLFQGSGDIAGLARAEGLALLPAGSPELDAGSEVVVLRPDW